MVEPDETRWYVLFAYQNQHNKMRLWYIPLHLVLYHRRTFIAPYLVVLFSSYPMYNERCYTDSKWNTKHYKWYGCKCWQFIYWSLFCSCICQENLLEKFSDTATDTFNNLFVPILLIYRVLLRTAHTFIWEQTISSTFIVVSYFHVEILRVLLSDSRWGSFAPCGLPCIKFRLSRISRDFKRTSFYPLNALTTAFTILVIQVIIHILS